MAVYDINGWNVSKDYPYLGKTALATMLCQDDLSTGHLVWGEKVAGGTETPFTNMESVYNGASAQADYRILSYEDGSPIIENGKVWFSMSSIKGRGTPGAIICEYDISTSQMKMTGVILAYYNGAYFSATGNSVMYNRNTHEWVLCTHSLTGHTLLIGKSVSDPRFGVTTIEYKDLDYEDPASGDEDQFIFYSSELEKWVMIYVAIRNNDTNYILRMHTSDYCDKDFEYYGQINDPSVLRATGITAVKVGGVRYILSGSSATGTNKFLIYSFPGLTYVGEINLDYTTGAQKGVWPVLFPITEGEQTRYWFLTFDRAATITADTWSYGCMYMYCALETNDGMEYPIQRDGTTVYDPVAATYSITQLHFKRQWAYRAAMDYKLKLSEINLDGAVRFNQSNLYPVIGSVSLTQDSDGLRLSESGSAIIVGGKHQKFAAYTLDRYNIQPGDKRSWVIFDVNNDVKASISVDRDGKVYGYNGSSEALLATMRNNSTELIVCTGAEYINVYEK